MREVAMNANVSKRGARYGRPTYAVKYPQSSRSHLVSDDSGEKPQPTSTPASFPLARRCCRRCCCCCCWVIQFINKPWLSNWTLETSLPKTTEQRSCIQKHRRVTTERHSIHDTHKNLIQKRKASSAVCRSRTIPDSGRRCSRL